MRSAKRDIDTHFDANFAQVNKYVEFPKLLNITTYVTPGSDEGVLEYELYAVLLHLDLYNTTAFGHYICATKAADGSWWLYDDDRVSPVSADEVLKSNAYMVRTGFFDRMASRSLNSITYTSSSIGAKRPGTWWLAAIHHPLPQLAPSLAAQELRSVYEPANGAPRNRFS